MVDKSTWWALLIASRCVLDFRGEFSGDFFSVTFPVLTAENTHTHTENTRKNSAKKSGTPGVAFAASFTSLLGAFDP